MKNFKKNLILLAITGSLSACGGSGGGSDNGGSDNDGSPSAKMVGTTQGAIAFGFESDSNSLGAISSTVTNSYIGTCDDFVAVKEVNEVNEDSGKVKTFKVFSSLPQSQCDISSIHPTNSHLLLNGTFKDVADIEGNTIEFCHMIRLPLGEANAFAECVLMETDELQHITVDDIAVSHDGEVVTLSYYAQDGKSESKPSKYGLAQLGGEGFAEDIYSVRLEYTWSSTDKTYTFAGNQKDVVFQHNLFTENEHKSDALLSISDGGNLNNLISYIDETYAPVAIGNDVIWNSTNSSFGDPDKIMSLDDTSSIEDFYLEDPVNLKRLNLMITHDIDIINLGEESVFLASLDKNGDGYYEGAAYSYNHDTRDVALLNEFKGTVPNFITLSRDVYVNYGKDIVIYWKTATDVEGVVAYNVSKKEVVNNGDNLLADYSDWLALEVQYTPNGFIMYGQDENGVNKELFYNAETGLITEEIIDNSSIDGAVPLMPSSAMPTEPVEVNG